MWCPDIKLPTAIRSVMDAMAALARPRASRDQLPPTPRALSPDVEMRDGNLVGVCFAAWLS